MNEKKVSSLLKKQIIITGVSVFLMVVVMLGGSYALFTSTSNSEAYNILKVGSLEISYVDTGEGLGDVLRLADAFPIPDSEGKTSSPYRFSVQNTGTLKATYKIKIIDDNSIITEDNCSSKQLSKLNLKYQFDQGTPELLGTKESLNYVVYEGTLSAGSSRIHEIRMWIDENSDNSVLGKHFHGKVVVEGIQDPDQPISNMMVKGTWNDTLSRYDDYFWKYTTEIKTIVFENRIAPVTNAIETWDLSSAKDNSVVGYLTRVDGGSGSGGSGGGGSGGGGSANTGIYIVTIQANGTIYGNPDSSSFFKNMKSLTGVEGIEYFNTSKVTDMSNMFKDISNELSSNITNIDLSNFSTSNVTNMANMFNGCSSLTKLDLSSFDTSKVTDMSQMFTNCTRLSELNVSSFNTSNVTNMANMFNGCSSLTNLAISNFNTTNVLNMKGMFASNGATTLDLSKFDTSKVTDMTGMFDKCSALIELRLNGFDFAAVTKYSMIFNKVPNTGKIYVKDAISQAWVISKEVTFSTANVLISP